MFELEKYVGKAVFAFGSELEDENPIDMLIAPSLKYIKESMSNVVMFPGASWLLVHGVLTSAVSIPEKLDDGVDIFVIIPKANINNDSYIVAIDSLELLEELIETIVSEEIYKSTTQNADALLDFVFDIDTQDIEGIFILYGYQIPITLTFDSTDISLEKTRKGRKIFASIAAHQE